MEALLWTIAVLITLGTLGDIGSTLALAAQGRLREKNWLAKRGAWGMTLAVLFKLCVSALAIALIFTWPEMWWAGAAIAVLNLFQTAENLNWV